MSNVFIDSNLVQSKNAIGEITMMSKMLYIFFLVVSPMISIAQDHSTMNHEKMSATQSSDHGTMPTSSKDCEPMTIWDMASSSCIAVPKPGMEMGMWMVHGNGFLVQPFAEGPRGRNEFSVPNMLMAEVGHTSGDKNYFAVNLMLTFEKWTFPKDGYPELLQIGERNEDDEPYVDAQHPHSSPIMGLTFSDVIALGGDNFVKVFFAPRGQSTDGPVAFMHRPTGMVNPDAPLGHHIGQDVSHITSTVLGVSLYAGKNLLEASVFNGTEPEPTKVDLPLGPLNSFSVRAGYQISDSWSGMVSASEVSDPEPHDPTLEKIWRYSASLYSENELGNGWKFNNSFIFGLVNNYDHVSALRSFLDEFWFHTDSPHHYWGRIEVLERTGSQLQILGLENPEEPQWVTALSAGYTYKWMLGQSMEAGMGLGVTKNLLPSDFRDTYGGDPWSGKIFFQLSGMAMGNY